MAKARITTSSELRIESITSDTMDVSVVRDFVKLLDAHAVAGHVPVQAYHDTDHGVVKLWVSIQKSETVEDPPTFVEKAAARQATTEGAPDADH